MPNKKYSINHALLLPSVTCSEALFAFAGYLINIKEKVDVMDKATMGHILIKFCEANNFKLPEEDFMKKIKTPEKL